MGYKVGLTDLARDDLGATVRFIAVEGENPEAALRMGHELLDAALSLAILPRRVSPVRRRPGMTYPPRFLRFQIPTLLFLAV